MSEQKQGELWTGPFSHEFENSFLEIISQKNSIDPLGTKLILVGSNLLATHLRHALSRYCGGHLNVRFINFLDLARAFNQKRLLLGNRRKLPLFSECLLLSDLCQKLPPSSRFWTIREQEGFHQALVLTFHELVENGIVHLENESEKLDEIGKLFFKHRENYLSTFLTPADEMIEALKSQETVPSIFGADRLFCYGFYDLTRAQRLLLEKCGEFTCLHAWVPTPGSSVNPIVQKTIQFFEELGLEKRQISAASNPKITKISAKISAMSAGNRLKEPEEVVRWLLRKLEEEPIPLHRIGILLRQPEEFAPLFSEVLDRACIPFYREGGTPLEDVRAGKAFLLFLDLLSTSWNRFDMIHLLSLVPLPEECTLNMGEPADWDRWSKEANAVKGPDEFLSKLGHHLEQLEQKKNPQAPVLKRFLEFLRKWFYDWEQLKSLSQNWTQFGIKCADWVQTFFGNDVTSNELAEICRSLSDMEDVGVTANIVSIRNILRKRLRIKGLQNKTFQKDGIFLGSILQTRCIPFDLVCIPGLEEGSFPSPPRCDPLILEEERHLLNRSQKSDLRLREMHLFEEQLIFGLALSQARKETLLSYSRFTLLDEKEILPSTFFIEHAGSNIEHLSLVRWSTPLPPFLDERDWVQREVSHGAFKDGDGFLRDLGALYPVTPYISNWVFERTLGKTWSVYDGLIPHQLLAAHEKPYSSSDFSTFAECPYRYFLRNVLKVSSLDSPEDSKELDPMDKGNLIHQILFHLFITLKKNKLLPLSKDNLIHATQHLEKVLEDICSQVRVKLVLNEPLWQIQKELILDDLKALLRQEASDPTGFIPKAFEVRFGMGKTAREDPELSTDEELILKTGEDMLRFCGKIDRIDLSADGTKARIIDYKTGSNKKWVDNAFQGGKSIQLAVYLSALPVLMREIDISLSDGILLSSSYVHHFKKVWFSGHALKQRKKEFEWILQAISHGIKKGQFIPKPGTDLENCKFCDFKMICGKGILKIFERKCADPVTKDLFDLEKIP